MRPLIISGSNRRKPQVKYEIGAYARLSYDRNGDPITVETQHDDNRRIAQQRGWSIANFYTDNDLSAYKKGVVRPAFEQMLVDLESGSIQGIIAYDLDRLWRQPVDLERVINFYEDGYRPFATAQGDYDLSTSDGRTMARIMVVMANKASADTSRRVKRKIALQAQEGKPRWSTRPYGWNMNGTLNEPEAAVIRQMVDWFISGYSYRNIMDRLNSSGARRRDGGLWQNTKVRRMLENPRIAAIRVHNGMQYPGIWEPIISMDRWQELQDAIKLRRQNMTGRPSNRRYMLTGLVICKNCDNFMSGMTKRDGFTIARPEGRLRRTYQCAHCKRMIVGSEPLAHFIGELVLYRLDSEELAKILAARSSDEKLEEMMEDRSGLMKRRQMLLNDYADGTLTKLDLKHTLARVDSRLAALNKEIDTKTIVKFKPALKAGESLREAWESRPDGWKRQLIELLIEKIVIHKSSMKPFYKFDGKRTRFDAERVEVHWKV
jgi:site-specific DNA recombinase